MRRILEAVLIIVCSVVLAAATFAQSQQPAVKCPDKSTSFGTGDAKGTYAQMFRDINGACSDLSLCEYINPKTQKPSEGGPENLTLFSTKEIDAGLADEAVLELAKRADKSLSNSVKGLLALHYNSLHIMVLSNGHDIKGKGWGGTDFRAEIQHIQIEELKHLKDKPIVAFASGVAYARLMNERLSLNMGITKVDKKEDGFEALKKNEAFAFFAVGGFPIKWVSDLDMKQFALLDVSESDIAKMQAPFVNVKLKYGNMPNVDGYNALSTRNVLVVKNYSGKDRVEKIMGLRKCVAQNVLEFQESRDAHPSWADVNPDKLDDFTWPPYDPKVKTAEPRKN
jgi:TRAP-type uncharacterized transport system substrate-binding protein